MKKRIYRWCIRLLIFIIACFVLGEIAVRVIGYESIDGQFHLLNRPVTPLVIQKQTMLQQLQAYRDSAQTARIQYHPALGWFNVPNYDNDDTGITHNSAGLRSIEEYSPTPDADTLRIAVIGDSYVYGAEVRDDETLIHYVTENLRSEGWKVEVMNFGMGGYGMGQIYLSYRELVRQYQPRLGDLWIYVS